MRESVHMAYGVARHKRFFKRNKGGEPQMKFCSKFLSR